VYGRERHGIRLFPNDNPSALFIMVRPDDIANRKGLLALLRKLKTAGWVSQWAYKGEQYSIKWTEIGRERMRWFSKIESDLDSTPDDLKELLVLCFLMKQKRNERN
jgi:hypothetical protein